MSNPLKTILIASSLADGSDGVVRTGVALARATGATPWLVHAYFPYLPPTLPSGGGIEGRWIEEQIANLKARMGEQAQRTGLSTLAGFSPDRLLLVVGSPHREIAELARHVQADLLVVGAAESGNVLLGSTADRLIRKAACPVLVVRSEAAFPPSRVEIPVDFSPISSTALRRGLELLARLGVPPAETEVLFVLNPYETAGSIEFTREHIRRFAGEELRRFLTANAPPSPQGVRPAATRVRTGYPRSEILAALKERRVDLAVLGTQGRSGFERLMIGSVAAGVLHGATCNLLIVPPGTIEQNATTEPRTRLTGADWSYVSDEAPAVSAGSLRRMS